MSPIPSTVCVYCFQNPHRHMKRHQHTSKLSTSTLRLASYSHTNLFTHGTSINKPAAVAEIWPFLCQGSPANHMQNKASLWHSSCILG